MDIDQETLNTLKDDEFEEAMERMESDWQIAENVDEEVIPYAIEYYLGVVREEEDDDFDGEDDDFDGDDSEDEDEAPKVRRLKKK